MRRLHHAAFAVMSVVLAGPVSAADLLDFTGVYGNAAGCRFNETGVFNDESIVLLKPGEFRTYAALCEFLQVLKPADGSSVLTTLCGHEGDAAQTIDFLRVVRSADADSYEVFGASGDLWGKVDRCS